MLAFTSVYFFESGLFNGLEPIGVKFSPHPNLVSENSRLSLVPRGPRRGLDPATGIGIARSSGARKHFVAKTAVPGDGPTKRLASGRIALPARLGQPPSRPRDRQLEAPSPRGEGRRMDDRLFAFPILPVSAGGVSGRPGAHHRGAQAAHAPAVQPARRRGLGRNRSRNRRP